MAPGKVTVFGGTGFLGQRVVQRLLERDLSVRVAVRHPERVVALFPALHLDAIQADVNDDRSVAAAVAGVEGAGFETFAPKLRTRVGARWRTVRSSPATCLSASSIAGAPSIAAWACSAW